MCIRDRCIVHFRASDAGRRAIAIEAKADWHSPCDIFPSNARLTMRAGVARMVIWEGAGWRFPRLRGVAGRERVELQPMLGRNRAMETFTSEALHIKSGTVIINSGAGGSVRVGAEDWGERLVERFALNGWKVALRCVSSAEVEPALREAVAAEPPALIVGGGDGTVLAAVTALNGKKIPLGIVPMGTFNSLARDLGIPTQWEEAVDALTRSRIREIDVARVNGRPFMSLCVLGRVAREVNAMPHGFPWWAKATRTLWLLMGSYFDYPAMHLQVDTGGGATCRHRTRLIAISNNPFRDEAGLIVPQRQTLDAGILMIYLSRHADRRALMRGGLAYLTGRMTGDPDLHMEAARRASIEVHHRRSLRLAVDGEIVTESLPLHFSIQPRQLRVFSAVPGREEILES